MTTRLLVLWLLSERPHHGYSIKAILTDAGFAPWFALEDASIYAMLKSLTRQGLAVVAGEEQPGNRPGRTLYKITAQGRIALATDMKPALTVTRARPEPVHAALAAIDELEPAELREALVRRQVAVTERLDLVTRQALAAPSGLVARRELALLDTELAWLKSELATHDQQWPQPKRNNAS